ncbi:PID-CTERM protein-sorting domain-containing protein [Pontibacter sp. HSC-36F09]|uniref:PID-CTERM protein-sorting domain-containing protein n=1 Tax=Pontibacter sp. HSC-36F09 TaxID=2910966 RepID=UPI0035327CC1
MFKLLTFSVLTLLIFLFTTTFDVTAQGSSNDRPGRSGDAPGRNRGATGVPIDGGIGALLAAGAAYGLKKLNDHRSTRRRNSPDA